jgi:hypothetical protein
VFPLLLAWEVHFAKTKCFLEQGKTTFQFKVMNTQSNKGFESKNPSTLRSEESPLQGCFGEIVITWHSLQSLPIALPTSGSDFGRNFKQSCSFNLL